MSSRTIYRDAIYKIKKIIANVYQQFHEIGRSEALTEVQRRQFMNVTADMDDVIAQSALQDLSYYCYLYYGRKAIILLDEYDTPMQEAYIHDYWDKFTSFVRGLFNSTFKTNPYLERALMTGITRISKASIFSDLNNLVVITATSERYAECFGFTEKEVFQWHWNFLILENRKVLSKRGMTALSLVQKRIFIIPGQLLIF